MNEIEQLVVKDAINQLPHCHNNPFTNGYHRRKKAELCQPLSTLEFSDNVIAAVETKIEDPQFGGYFL